MMHLEGTLKYSNEETFRLGKGNKVNFSPILEMIVGNTLLESIIFNHGIAR